MKLYYMQGACSLAPHIALEWIKDIYKVSYETQRVSHDDIKKPEYLLLNPMGSVPCLVDGDFTLTQCIALMEYLHSVYPKAKLMGDENIQTQAETRRWLALLVSDLHSKIGPLFSVDKIEDAKIKQYVKDNALASILPILTLCNKILQERSYLSAKRSVADAYLFVVLGWVDHLGISLADQDGLYAFKERMLADKGVQNAVSIENS